LKSSSKKAVHFTRVGDKARALEAFDVVTGKAVGSGQRLDVVFAQIRLGIFWSDMKLQKEMIDKADSYSGNADWDRKNRLKIYEAIYLMSSRSFPKAAKLLLDTLSTFSAVELLSLDEYVSYVITLALVASDRATLKKLIEAPEVLQVIDKIPHLGTYLNAFYDGDYADFFLALADVNDHIKLDPYLHPHSQYYCREMRVLAYNQLLQSYKSVQLSSMAQLFGVSIEYLDRELARFIAIERIHCKIDRVKGIVETTRPDTKNAQYQQTIKQGDALLNRIQKLSRVINL